MANTSERVRALKEHFIEERRNGNSFAEIAKKYHVSQRYLYIILQEIADANGIERKDLLDFPHKEHERTDSRNEPPIDLKEIQVSFDSILEETNKILEKITTIIGGTSHE